MKIEYELEMTVEDLIQEMRAKYGSIDKLSKKITRGRASFQERADHDAWRAYVGGGAAGTDTLRVKKAAVFRDPIMFFKFLSPERIRILDQLRTKERVESLNELARQLGRDPKNVYEDVRALEKRGLVRIERRNRRRSIPHLRVQRVTVTV